MKAPKILPYPRYLEQRAGCCRLPNRISLRLDPALPEDTVRQPVFETLAGAFLESVKVKLVGKSASGLQPLIRACEHQNAPSAKEGYRLLIEPDTITLHYREVGGLRAGVATLAQLVRQFGRRLPCLAIRDWPDFARRGVMLDVSRGRVPKLETLKQLAEDLARFKINELQLYLEHIFAYRNHPEVWRDWGPLTAHEIRKLDTHCQRLGIDLVPNQNSFGHLRHWLEHDRFKPLAEVKEPYPSADGTFLRYPTTLSPVHPGSLPFLRELYDELLPNFTSRFFNVGGDETWDLGRGLSKNRCQQLGQGRVYLDFLLKVHREVSRRGRRMMFWGDIILKYPELIRELPKDVVALEWGYEADHPLEKEAAAFKRAGTDFYICPGTSTWQTLIGRHDNALANLAAAARAGRRHAATGYLITDWGDGGHPQPLAVSYPLYLAGAAQAWCRRSYDEDLLVPVLSREVFCDRTQRVAAAAMELGIAHRKFGYMEANATPFGAAIAAPPSEQRELFCRNGLKYYARISGRNIRSAQAAVRNQRARLFKGKPHGRAARDLAAELGLAARLAEASCDYLLWQQAVATGRSSTAKSLARAGMRNLRELKRAVNRYWPARNKGTPGKSMAFLDWRLRDYRTQRLHYSPEQAEGASAVA